MTTSSMSIVFTHTTTVTTRKAPKGKTFLVGSIHLAILTGGDNFLVFIGRNIRGRSTLSLPEREAIVTFPTDTTGDFHSFTPKNAYRTKWISIGRNSANAISTVITIEYELAPLSKREALMEWFMKG